MLSIDFQDGGKVHIYASEDGDTISVTADANKVRALMPGTTLDALRDRMATFLDLTATAPALRDVTPSR